MEYAAGKEKIAMYRRSHANNRFLMQVIIAEAKIFSESG